MPSGKGTSIPSKRKICFCIGVIHPGKETGERFPGLLRAAARNTGEIDRAERAAGKPCQPSHSFGFSCSGFSLEQEAVNTDVCLHGTDNAEDIPGDGIRQTEGTFCRLQPAETVGTVGNLRLRNESFVSGQKTEQIPGKGGISLSFQVVRNLARLTAEFGILVFHVVTDQVDDIFFFMTGFPFFSGFRFCPIQHQSSPICRKWERLKESLHRSDSTDEKFGV